MKTCCYIVIVLFLMSCTERTHSEIQNDSETNKNSDADSEKNDVQPKKLEWVKIEAGSFTYGSPQDTPCKGAYADELVNVVLTNSFQMATTEVTQYQWEQAGLKLPPQDTVGPNMPVVFVNFYEAAAFCNELSKKEGLDPCYDLSSCMGDFAAACPKGDPDHRNCRCSMADTTCKYHPELYHCDTSIIHKYTDRYSCPGYRMPTSAEWEYAARAETTTHTYNGDLLPWENVACQEHPVLNDIAWYCFNAGDKMHTVAQKTNNVRGLYDMLGNVKEWVDHRYTGYSLAEAENLPGQDLTNPVGITGGDTTRMETRGGTFNGESCFVKTSGMTNDTASARRMDTSFRPVRTLFEPQK